MAIWQLCANLLIPNCLRSNLSYSPLAALELYVKNTTSKILVAYFSVTGTTENVAKNIAEITNGELYKIVPSKSYTNADLDWNDKKSRSSVEMNNPQSRPALKSKMDNIQKYDIIFLGYPIWWNLSPRIINTFIESHVLKGKMLIPFATSGGSSIANSVKILKRTYPELDWKEGKLLNRTDKDGLRVWIECIK